VFVVNHLTLQEAEEAFRHRVIQSSYLDGSYSAGSPMPKAALEKSHSHTGCRDHYG
jgi:hypothetical protein